MKNMSRSFYVDSLIVKGQPKERLTSVTSTGSPQHASQVISLPTSRVSTPTHISTIHPVPCYPRHAQEMMNMCCPLCVHPSQHIMSDSTVPLSIIPTSGMLRSLGEETFFYFILNWKILN